MITTVYKDGHRVGTIDMVTTELTSTDPVLHTLWNHLRSHGIDVRVCAPENGVFATRALHLSLREGICTALTSLSDDGYDAVTRP